MTEVIPRLYPRTVCEVPIQYSLLNSETFESTHTFDMSADGLSYETIQVLEPETEICIVMENYDPDREGLEAYRSYVARVRWNHLFSSNGTDRYAAGAKILARSHDIMATEAQIPRLTCDLCNAEELIHRLDQTQSLVGLCQKCMKHFTNIPPGKIRQCVERFLSGNVI